MSKQKQAISPALRSWTRGVSFTLAMGKTQVATLVSVHLSQGGTYPPIGHAHKLVRQFITAMHGLEERGLVVAHIWRQPQGNAVRFSQGRTFGQCWQVTEAGEHVVALLKLTGIYDELRVELEAADVRDRVRLA